MKCGRCGQEIPKGSGIIPHDHPTVVLCDNCGIGALYRCGTCVHEHECLINSYDGPMPKMVIQRVQQGPMVAQQQVINPDLVRELCPTCFCGSMENCQGTHTCDNYKGFYQEE